MLTQTLFIINKLGLHARASSKLVKLASSFESKIDVKCKQQQVNAKSIMGIMFLAAAKGTEIELIISGADEKNAMERLCELIQNGFGEEE
ncbi:MAG: HPr family phosphocarrier protein [Thiotrichaceae bacterium]|nr:HPr family phosphocarrier protein [Thiotrichaceae bacterium]